MIYRSTKNPHSHLTGKLRTGPSLPTRALLAQGRLTGRLLDFGCGHGMDVAFLREKGFDVVGYDPVYAPDYPEGRFDTILCHYVLNVLLPEEQAHVLMAVSELLNPTGCAYFTVRRDIKQAGFRTHTKFGEKVYQCNVVLPYPSVMRTENMEMYVYRHINRLTAQEEPPCPFCQPSAALELITESATAYAMLDKYPVAPGHTLVIPKLHTADYFALPERTKQACWLMVDRVKLLVQARWQPDGFNVGFNVGAAAGQTIPHVHLHVIPRHVGDVANPTGGVRNVIPGRGDYLQHD